MSMFCTRHVETLALLLDPIGLTVKCTKPSILHVIQKTYVLMMFFKIFHYLRFTIVWPFTFNSGYKTFSLVITLM